MMKNHERFRAKMPRRAKTATGVLAASIGSAVDLHQVAERFGGETIPLSDKG
jgi:hypothetical protein